MGSTQPAVIDLSGMSGFMLLRTDAASWDAESLAFVCSDVKVLTLLFFFFGGGFCQIDASLSVSTESKFSWFLYC